MKISHYMVFQFIADSVPQSIRFPNYMSVFLCQNFLASWSSVTIAILLWTLLWIPASLCLFVCVMLNVQTCFIDHALAIHFFSAVSEFLKFPLSFLNWIWRLEMTKCLYHVHKINLRVYRHFAS